MSVIFSTYQSVSVITAAQEAGIPDFDLVIADEAHRTTGVTLAGEDAKVFTRVHDDAHIAARKRLYMTATPRVFSDAAKGKAASADAWLASMDDPGTYGPEFHRLGFNEAVTRDLLTDYKALVLAVDEEAVSAAFQKQLSDEDHELRLDDATRIVGCVNALAKRDVYGETFGPDDQPMQRAVAFSNTIAHSKKFKALFTEIADQWNSSVGHRQSFHVEVDHVDGKFNSMQREALLRWLKEALDDNACHVLSNAKCLTEGVDVPALDAILFLEPRNSMVDVIQAVGRVMRKAEGKAYGYVVLPVGIPADETPETVLKDNKRFKAVWQVLNALRSHDERMNAVINKLDLNDEPPDIIEVIPVGIGDLGDDGDPEPEGKPRQLPLSFPLDEIREGIYAKLVLKVGTRHYWEDWASDVAEIASRHQSRINALLDDPALGLGSVFDHFVEGLHTIINDSISREDAVAMLSQHLITKPVFDALFTDYDFAASNPVSRVMQDMIGRLDEHSLEKEAERLEGFYRSVRLRVEGIDNAAGKQRIITELYEGFFSKAFPKAAESLGIVYTPVELVDFILNAANHALRKHFDGGSMSDADVNILDPFCGTGTFLARLIQSEIIKPEDLARKYASELHSNELLLLAYYIAAVNIESTYHDLVAGNGNNTAFEPFKGIVLTDTFELGEVGEGTGAFDVFPVNNERATRQKSLGIRVIVGNPPYSVGQTSQNDDNQNLTYEHLDLSITNSYADLSVATNKNSLYDSYVRAFRWGSDRVLPSDEGGIVAFVTNGGFVDANTFDGFRKTIASEFHHIYCYNLRGNARTAGTQRQKEAGNAFGGGSRASVAITLLVKKPGVVSEGGAEILYRDIGDYLSREEKLDLIGEAATQDALDNVDWERITPNKHGDWINQRSDVYGRFSPLIREGTAGGEPIFDLRSRGLETSRDAWNYNSSAAVVKNNGHEMVDFYNTQVGLFERAHPNLTGKPAVEAAKRFVDRDPTKFSWTADDFRRVARREYLTLDESLYVTAMYRPFFRQIASFDPLLNTRLGQVPRMFPHTDTENLCICLPAAGPGRIPFTPLMVREVPDVCPMGSDACNVYPMWVYESPASKPNADALFDSGVGNRRHNVTDPTIASFKAAFGDDVSKDDVFFYVYGILSSPIYRDIFTSDLKKQNARIPQVETSDEFWGFSKAGRDLSDLHTRYDEIEPWPDLQIQYAEDWNPSAAGAYEVERIRYPRNGKDIDKNTVIFNTGITISGIPDEAHDYRIGTRSAIDWLVDRYRIRTHKASGIVNDPNDWADEHDDPTYIFDLLRRIVTVSMRTNDIIDGLPPLKI